ncbi:MarR family winged helix-turn-helix transcriptional regulator [Bosea sp. NPDC003192]|jgi:DNA-binding MarR family transcriptional regulator|uniref:MarR family winged helix-turn-helix transcriptional regulator n=1 Tax=Bosea sp. NPDC003192 TaxID=3390551 RepID=UPI003D01BF91
MSEARDFSTRDALTGLILILFRVNNLTLSWGDKLVAPFGLTSARWQILGAIVFAERPQPVSWLARDLGANRQNVQRIVNDLHKEGLVVFAPNPHHRRAQLVLLTEKGQQAYAAAVASYNPKADILAEGLSEADLEAAHRVMVVLRNKLERETDAEERG